MKFVAVFKGSRDRYQAALALEEAGLLERLVTDFYAPLDGPLAGLGAMAPRLKKRYCEGLPARKVKSLWSELLRSQAMPQSASLAGDRALGRYAGRLATRTGSGIFSYSYYGHAAFEAYRGKGPKVLFQVHPHARMLRAIFARELEKHSEMAASLRHELEMAAPAGRLAELEQEGPMADSCLCASGFTRQSLLDAGVAPERIRVVPYGIDLDRYSPDRFFPDPGPERRRDKLRVLFVGQLNARKGLHYLLPAWQRLKLPDAELVLAGRNADSALLARFEGSFRLEHNPAGPALVELFRSADVFCFPSLGEGFGLVLLESLACGTPVITTNNTGVHEAIEEKGNGLVIPAGDGEALAEALQWCSQNRKELRSMRAAARRLAEGYTWKRFREGIAEACQMSCSR